MKTSWEEQSDSIFENFYHLGLIMTAILYFSNQHFFLNVQNRSIVDAHTHKKLCQNINKQTFYRLSNFDILKMSKWNLIVLPTRSSFVFSKFKIVFYSLFFFDYHDCIAFL